MTNGKVLREDLLQSMLAGEDLNSIVNKAALLLNNPLVIINTSYTILSSSTVFPVQDYAWNLAVSRGYITFEFAATLNHWEELAKKENKPYLTFSEISPVRRRFYRLEINQKLVGYLNITESHSPFDNTEEQLYQFAAQIIAKEIYTQKEMMPSFHTIAAEDLLEELCDNSFVSRVHFSERIQGSPLDKKTNFLVGFCDLSHFISYNAADDTFKNELRSFFNVSTMILQQLTLIVLIDLNSESKETAIHLPQLIEYLRSRNLKFGFSDPFCDLYLFRRYLKQAQIAIQLSPLTSTEVVSHYDNVKFESLLQQIPSTELTFYCSIDILHLWNYDQQHETDYLNTLYQYLSCGKSISQTATKMYLHRNTINYRIAKIKEILNTNLEDAVLLHQFYLSCQILQFTQR